jgi:branched-chain amino acid transport system permease protein
MLTILFDGVAYGMLLFVLACGLSVTLGLMNFVNLAHGAFAMAGGYITVVLVNRVGLPFYAGLVLASARYSNARSMYMSTERATSTRCCSP